MNAFKRRPGFFTFPLLLTHMQPAIEAQWIRQGETQVLPEQTSTGATRKTQPECVPVTSKLTFRVCGEDKPCSLELNVSILPTF